MYYCTSSEPALWWSVYVTLESACDHLRACESRCLSVRGPISTIYHPAASSSPGTSRWKYIVHGGCSIASVPHVPNTPTVELLGQPYQLLVHWRYAKADQGHVCCAEQQRWLWSTTRTRKSRMRTTKETSRRAALLMALQQRRAGSQTRLPACLLCHSLSAIYTRPLYAQAHKTIHRCTVVENG
jgi:hypothetical protein